ncbi:hypothetical protein TNCV_1390871 [Trichonephila clavipes]|nr:hypothetical protein TNCV_1390871 [Trichonephila clavipes]
MSLTIIGAQFKDGLIAENISTTEHLLATMRMCTGLEEDPVSVLHLSNWRRVGDNTGVAILDLLKQLSLSREIRL